MAGWGSGQGLADALARYRPAREAFLREIGCRPRSMRDPLAEFAELFVAALTGEQPATNPVQKGWDLRAGDGTTTQVRYVANPSDKWVNGHVVKFDAGVDRYALVVYESLEPTSVLIFSRGTLGHVCQRLGKRHPSQDTTIQVTPENVRRMKADRHGFAELGVTVFP